VRKFLGLGATTLLLLSMSVAGVSAGGPPQPAIYVDDVLYRTVGTPTDFSGTGAPAHSYDTIYPLGEDADGNPLMSVATAAPGDRDYNGGRWMVLPITWNVDPVQLTNDEQVLAYEAMGKLDIADTPAKFFECPVIPMRGKAHG
jgi:hypothetical protein